MSAMRRMLGGADLTRYRADEQLRFAVEPAVEIIGKLRAAYRPPSRRHPEIAWARIIAQRNVLAHEYDAINDALFWTTLRSTCRRCLC